MELFPAYDETLSGLSESLRLGQRTCASIVNDCLRQVDLWEDRVHAWVSVDRDGALARAAELDDDLRAGRIHGPLHGIPIGIKDLIDVAGTPTGAGSPLLAQQVVSRDAVLVTRLREAGAILLGKTVTTQFACFDPSVTRNPWNLEKTPGGSSSGSAAAVATGMCIAAIGSQTGGSITRPAAFCGVAGLKPSFGSIPIDGVYPVAESLDHPGPIARSVADLAALFAVLSGTPAQSLTSTAPPKLGRLRGLFEVQCEPVQLEQFRQTCQTLTAAGGSMVDAPLPETFADVLAFHRRIMLYELAEVHQARFALHPDDYLPGIRGLIEEARQITESAYREARLHQERLQAEIAGSFAGADVLICPATIGPAPDRSTTGVPTFNSPWSYTGLPTVSFPTGLSPDGLPLSIQLVGRRNDEATLFRAAAWCEQMVQKARSQ